jgi:hypothetical protein
LRLHRETRVVDAQFVQRTLQTIALARQLLVAAQLRVDLA